MRQLSDRNNASPRASEFVELPGVRDPHLPENLLFEEDPCLPFGRGQRTTANSSHFRPVSLNFELRFQPLGKEVQDRHPLVGTECPFDGVSQPDLQPAVFIKDVDRLIIPCEAFPRSGLAL